MNTMRVSSMRAAQGILGHWPNVHTFKSIARPKAMSRLVVQSSSNNSDVQKFKQVAQYIADTYIIDGEVIGLGTGLPVNAFIEEISERLTSGRLKSIKCVPASDVSASEAAFHGVPLTTLEEAGAPVAIVIDVADEVDISPSGRLSYIVGRGENGPQTGQPSLPRLRELLQAAQRSVVVAPGVDTCTLRLGGHVPIEIYGDEDTWEETAEVLDDIFLGDAEIRRRSWKVGAGPRGDNAPVQTSEGHMILDIQFYEGIKLFGEVTDYAAVVEEIEAVDGVVAHGLVPGVVAGRTLLVADEVGELVDWQDLVPSDSEMLMDNQD